MMTVFQDRQQAGEQLAKRLHAYKQRPDTVVLGLPRGGVPVAYAVAKPLELPLDTFLVRKIGAPGHEELAVGAIADQNTCILNQHLMQQLGLTQSDIQTTIVNERAELERRNKLYRQGRSPAYLQNQTIILVDDGIATGATMEAAIEALGQLQVQSIIIAVPVASPDSLDKLRPQVDELVCMHAPQSFQAVGQWYVVFDQTSDAQVCELLNPITR